MRRNRKVQHIVMLVLVAALFLSFSGYVNGIIKKDNIESKQVFKTSDSEGEKSEEETARVSIAAVGDNLLHMDIIKDAKKKDGGYDFKPIYENIKGMISKADIAMINQETVLGGSKLGYSGYPCFNSPQEVGKNLIEIGFDVINHANNHALDKGSKGITNTLAFWKGYPNTIVTGIYGSSEDRQKIRVIDKNGIKIAFLSYTYGTNNISVPKDKPYSVNIINKGIIADDVKRAREVADAVVVSMHWGDEYKANPSAAQIDLANFLADIGVNLVIGHHPHVLQPVELIKGKDGNDTFVAYSLGNLVSCQDKTPRLLGGLLNVVIEKDKAGNISIKEPSMVPLVTHYDSSRRGFKIYPIDKYTTKLAKIHGISKLGKAFNIEELNKIAAPVIKSVINVERIQEVINNSNIEGTKNDRVPDYTVINDKLEKIAKKYKAVGMSVAVVRDGGIEWTKNVGFADKEKRIPANDETVYRIASISKTISNMVVMTLYDKGLVKLDGDIGEYLGFNVRNPNYPKEPITLKSIMTHTSSISDYGTYTSIMCSGKGYPTLKNMLTPGSNSYSRRNFCKYPPDGRTFNYSNFGAGIMGAIVESTTGKKFNDYAKETLFEPMNLDAGFLIDDISDIEKVANLYMGGGLNYNRTQALKEKSKSYQLPIGNNYRLANGNLYISAKDLAKLMMVLMNDGMYEGKRILSKDAVDLMEKIYWSGESGFHKLQGLSLHITDDLVKGRRLYGHQGRAYGLTAEMFYDKLDRTGVVYISNGCVDIKAPNGFTAIGSEVINAVYEEIDKQ